VPTPDSLTRMEKGKLVKGTERKKGVNTEEDQQKRRTVFWGKRGTDKGTGDGKKVPKERHQMERVPTIQDLPRGRAGSRQGKNR